MGRRHRMAATTGIADPGHPHDQETALAEVKAQLRAWLARVSSVVRDLAVAGEAGRRDHSGDARRALWMIGFDTSAVVPLLLPEPSSATVQAWPVSIDRASLILREQFCRRVLGRHHRYPVCRDAPNQHHSPQRLSVVRLGLPDHCRELGEALRLIRRPAYRQLQKTDWETDRIGMGSTQLGRMPLVRTRVRRGVIESGVDFLPRQQALALQRREQG